MEKFAQAISETLAEVKGIELSAGDVQEILEAADQKMEMGILQSMAAAHQLLDQVGVPKVYADGNDASLDARLVAYIRYVQSARSGCSGGCCS
jgi:hypothetical protein